MFGELIGLALAQCWLDQGQPAAFTLAELGPGRGTLMADALRAASRVRGFAEAAQLVLVEASPLLRDRQAEALAAYHPSWIGAVGDLPGQPLYLVANEFFDALPVRQFQRAETGWRERQVGLEGGALALGLAAEGAYPALDERQADTRPGDIVELCPAAATVAGEVARRIADHGGAALFLDYGDWHSLGDTVQALKDHKSVSLFETPGHADLTAGKLGAGWAAGSRALLADGLHSLGDVLSALASAVGTRIGGAPADEDHPFGGLERGGLPALSDGKGVLAGHSTLYYTDGVTITADDIGDEDALSAVAASSGTVFAFGERWDWSTVVGHFGRSNDGSGWTSLPMNGIPAGARLTSAWADAPDDVWIGYGTTSGGGLVHHDGTSATVVDSSLPSAPTSMRRGVDGTLWLSLADMLGGGNGMWVWDGTAMSRVPDLPDDTRSAYQVSDGTTFVTTFDQETDLSQILRSGPSGWEVSSEGLDITRLVGHGDTVVAGRHAGVISWSAICTP